MFQFHLQTELEYVRSTEKTCKLKFKCTNVKSCTTYGPRAKCGPPKLFIWPHAMPNMLSNKLDCLEKTLGMGWKKYQFLGPLEYAKQIFRPAWDLSCAPLLELHLLWVNSVFPIFEFPTFSLNSNFPHFVNVSESHRFKWTSSLL